MGLCGFISKLFGKELDNRQFGLKVKLKKRPFLLEDVRYFINFGDYIRRERGIASLRAVTNWDNEKASIMFDKHGGRLIEGMATGMPEDIVIYCIESNLPFNTLMHLQNKYKNFWEYLRNNGKAG